MKLTIDSSRRSARYQDTGDVGKYIRQAEALGIKVPAGVTKAHKQARQFRALIQDTQDGPQPVGVEALGRRLGSGTIDLEEADRQLPAAATLGPEDYVRARIKMLATAAEAATEEARKVLHGMGDKLLDPVRAVAMAALDDHQSIDAEARWKAAHALAKHLRAMTVVPRVKGLAPAQTEQAYRLARLDEADRWRDENADPRTGKRPALTLQAIAAPRARFGAGLHSAAEVVEASQSWSFDEPEESTPPESLLPGAVLGVNA